MIRAAELFSHMGLDPDLTDGGGMDVRTPIDGSVIGSVMDADPVQWEESIGLAEHAFERWRDVPAPRRGELVRRFGEVLREHKDALGRLVTLEAGKILSEGLGEVQEMIDICDFAVGLSRQLYGLTIASERPGHRMIETWHPLGPVGVITAFNFPVAVWAWNAALALVCGDPVVWKPSEKTPLTALACHALLGQLVGDDPALRRAWRRSSSAAHARRRGAGRRRRASRSSPPPARPRWAARVGPRVAARFGRTLLELGGNNAMIVAPIADLDLAVRAIVFAAVGTAGQRCTTLRRLIVHASIHDELVESLTKAYASVPIGDPLEPGTLVGPLIDDAAHDRMQAALDEAQRQGGTRHGGGRVLAGALARRLYVEPAIVEMPAQTAIVQEETFAPILYVMPYDELDEAIAIQNGVPQGLSSAHLHHRPARSRAFLSAAGSDCGIANVNIGPSGAEIGGAFGGEKDTGGGREAGSDAWKAYMRRTTTRSTTRATCRWPRASTSTSIRRGRADGPSGRERTAMSDRVPCPARQRRGRGTNGCRSIATCSARWPPSRARPRATRRSRPRRPPASRAPTPWRSSTPRSTSRHLDLAARWMRAAATASTRSARPATRATPPSPPRCDRPTRRSCTTGPAPSTCAGRMQVPGHDALRDVLLGVAAATDEPIAGGRHKVFGQHDLAIIPQTSTIASHLPRALGVAFCIDRARRLGVPSPWPADAIAVCSFGDASANHSTATGAINAACPRRTRACRCRCCWSARTTASASACAPHRAGSEAAYGARPGLR